MVKVLNYSVYKYQKKKLIFLQLFSCKLRLYVKNFINKLVNLILRLPSWFDKDKHIIRVYKEQRMLNNVLNISYAETKLLL